VTSGQQGVDHGFDPNEPGGNGAINKGRVAPPTERITVLQSAGIQQPLGHILFEVLNYEFIGHFDVET